MADIMSSIFSSRMVGETSFNGLANLNNVQLRTGEVKKSVPPDSANNRSKRAYEYEVLVQIMEDAGVTYKMYHNCQILDSFGGLGDFSAHTLRESDQKGAAWGKGSKVLVLCVDGNDGRAYIIGGERRRKDTSKGHHLVFEFNGVLFEINDDGSWTLTNKGKTDLKGGADPARSDGAGTQVKVEANGNFEVNTPNKQKIKINNQANTIEIESQAQVKITTTTAHLDAKQILLGSAPAFSFTRGEPLAALLSTLCTVIGPTLPTPAQKAAIAGVLPLIPTILSPTIKGQ